MIIAQRQRFLSEVTKVLKTIVLEENNRPHFLANMLFHLLTLVLIPIIGFSTYH